MRRATAWTIAGTDPTGGAGIGADLATLHGLGVHAGFAVTALLAQDTTGVRAIERPSRSLFAAQLAALADDLPPGAVKTGMLADAPTVRAVVRVLRGVQAPLVCDPVLASSGGCELLDAPGRRALVELLLPRVDLLTPNRPEAALLAGRTLRGRDGARRVAEALLARGARAVLLKGGHGRGAAADDLLFDGAATWTFRSPRRRVRHTHGTGCTLSAAIAAGLARGLPLPDAVALGKAYVNQGLRLGGGIGRGRGPLWHGGWPREQQDWPLVARAGTREPPARRVVREPA